MTRLNPDYRRIAERLLLNAEMPVSLTSALAKALRSGKPRMTRPATSPARSQPSQRRRPRIGVVVVMDD